MNPHDLSLEALRDLVELSRFADDQLEECLRERLSLRASLERFLPALTTRMGAVGAAVLTRDEELNPAAFAHGDLAGHDAWTLLNDRSDGVHRIGTHVLACQELDVAGTKVGKLGIVLAVDPGDERLLLARLETVCEELDGILNTVRTASEKQDLIQRINRALSNRVFEKGLDDAVELIHSSVGFKTLVFIWRDAVDESICYRFWREGKVEFDDERRQHPGLEVAIREHGIDLLSPERSRVRSVLGIDGCLENVLVSGTTRADWLGKLLVEAGPKGFSTFALDLVRLMAEMARERLVDYNRERRHLSQFFPASVINELLREPAYQEKYLSPREERVALIYADINSFTKLSELVLEKPTIIGNFVDTWSAGAVDILWRNGGMFDKMVGDCVIGIFGPPFYRDAPEQRALAALRSAREIQQFTVKFGEEPIVAKLKQRPDVAPGLGVAVGVNLCPACVGTFGPNHDITAFSAGMNATARLQSLAGFRETAVMESVLEAVKGVPAAAEFGFGPLIETPVKNVSRPLRWHKLQ